MTTILRQSSDWELWYSQLRATPFARHIWNYVNIEVADDKLPRLADPLERLEEVGASTNEKWGPVETFKFNRIVAEHEKAQAALDELASHILRTVAPVHHHLLTDHTTPRSMLQSLSKKLKPETWEVAYSIRRQLEQQSKGWNQGNGPSLRLLDWVDQWERVYSKARSHGLDGIDRDDVHVTWLFLKSVSRTHMEWASSQLRELRKPGSEKFKTIIDDYREVVRLQSDFTNQLNDDTSSATAYSASTSSPTKTPKTRKRNCVCGRIHAGLCWAICEDQRPEGWTMSAETKKRVDDALAKSPNLRKLRDDHRRKQDTSTNANTTSPSRKRDDSDSGGDRSYVIQNEFESYVGILPADLNSRTEKISIEGRNETSFRNQGPTDGVVLSQHSALLDSGTTGHIVNNRDRFVTYTSFHETNRPKLFGVGQGAPEIFGIGLAYIWVKDTEGHIVKMGLKDAAYVPECPMNLVSFQSLKRNGLYWDTVSHLLFVFDRVTGKRVNKYQVSEIARQHVLEFVPPDSSSAFYGTEQPDRDDGSSPAPESEKVKTRSDGQRLLSKSTEPRISSASETVWHQRLGHPSDEVLRHFSNAVTGMKITPPPRTTTGPKSSCETCHLSNAPRQISRRPMDRGTRPWQVVYFDIVFVRESDYGYKCFIHFYCMFSHDHAIRLLRTPGEAPGQIRDFHRSMKRYGCVPEKYHTDGETSLAGGTDFDSFTLESNVHFEVTVPHTPEQNGPAERSGGMITSVFRSLMIMSGLPWNLWHFAAEYAVYLLRRRPVAGLGWKTPFEMVFHRQPDLSNMKVFGCRAYRRLPNVPKLDKMAPRSEPGFFVGIQASNIWRIWVPERKTVVSARDVTFMEDVFFDPTKPIRIIPHTVGELEEPMMYHVPEFRVDATVHRDWTGSGDNHQLEDNTQVPTTLETTDQPVNESSVLDSGPQRNQTEEITQAVVDTSQSLVHPQPEPQPQSPEPEPEPEVLELEGPKEDSKVEDISYMSPAKTTPPPFDPRLKPTLLHRMTTPPPFPAEQLASPSPTPALSRELVLDQQEDQFGDDVPMADVLPQVEPNSSTGEELSAQPSNVRVERPVSVLHYSEPRADTLMRDADSAEAPDHQQEMNRQQDRDRREAEVQQYRYEQQSEAEILEYREILQDQRRAEQFSGTRRPRIQNYAPRSEEISADLLQQNILSAPRERKRKDAYKATLEEPPDSLLGLYQSFAAGLSFHTEQEVKWHRMDLPKPPKSWAQLLRLPEPHRSGFLDASHFEYETIGAMGTWVEVDCPSGAEILPLKWVWDYKYDQNGCLRKYKARLCVRGDLQHQWITFGLTYAATLSSVLIRFLLALAAVYDYDTDQRDMVNAFLNSQLDYTVYVHFPPGLGTQKKGKCLLLLKALYGLKQAPRLWQEEFTESLRQLGLDRCSEQYCIFRNQYLLLFFFVDDVITLYKREHRDYVYDFWKKLGAKYAARSMGEISWFLGMRILRDRPRKAIFLSQDAYVDKVVMRFHLRDEKKPFPSTPLPTNDFPPNPGLSEKWFTHLYQQKIGCVIFLSTQTRPDVAYAANKLSSFMTNPSRIHMAAVDHLLRYLDGTRYQSICFSTNYDPAQPFTAASDAAFADHRDRKSTGAYLFRLFAGPIDWSTHKQRTVTTSSTEAELLALSEAAKQMLWWHRLFGNLSFTGMPRRIDCDNSQTVRAMIRDEAIQTRLRHIDIHNHWAHKIVL